MPTKLYIDDDYFGDNPCKEILLDVKGKCKMELTVKLSVLVRYENSFGATANKKYVFNLISKDIANLQRIKVGSLIKISDYTNGMIVTDILQKQFRYVNRDNGDMKVNMTNTNDFKIKEIDLDKLEQIVSFVEV